MNAGGHGSDMAACLVQADVFDLHSQIAAWRPAESLGLRFRGSNLLDHEIVLFAELDLAEGSTAQSEHEIAEIVRWRRENQPGGQKD